MKFGSTPDSATGARPKRPTKTNFLVRTLAPSRTEPRWAAVIDAGWPSAALSRLLAASAACTGVGGGSHHLPEAAVAPRAASRRAFRHPAALPAEPLGVEVLAAAVKHARQHGRAFAMGRTGGDLGDRGAELSVAAGERGEVGRLPRLRALRLLARAARHRPRADHGLEGIPHDPLWRPHRGDEQVARFVKRHRKSVQRWLDWLQLAGLVSHTPQQDEEGFWWRTIIQLHAAPQLPAELLQEAVDRRAGWPARERRRDARGRLRNLTAILRRARLTKAQRRSRGIARRRELALPRRAPAGTRTGRAEPR